MLFYNAKAEQLTIYKAYESQKTLVYLMRYEFATLQSER